MPKHGHPRLPRVILLRHGETEWSLSGQHTGLSDIPLTQHGEAVVAQLGPKVTGAGSFLDPTHLAACFVSPRTRAQRTFELLFGEHKPDYVIESLVREWDYGDYEGLTSETIRKTAPDWDIWTQGCPNGESPESITKRIDEMMKRIVDIQHEHYHDTDKESHGDILIVSHGHFTRCFIARWCDLALSQGRIFVADAGAITVLGYQHGTFAERSLLAMNLFSGDF